jgi:Protein of unknown function (DUF998)
MTTRDLLTCGVIAGPLFVVVFLLEGATLAKYDALRHPVSSLALGDLGWIQVANFIVSGLLTLAFAAGARRALQPSGGSTWGPLLVAACGAGFFGAGIFATDPLGGYPPGTPERLQYSLPGALHQLFSTFYFVGLPAACFVFARSFAEWGERGWAIGSATAGVVFVVAFVLAAVGFSQTTGLASFGGLFQRIAIIVGEGWLSLLALHLRKTV